MTYEMYMYIFIVSLCLTIFMLIISICMFVKLKIWNIIGNFTGINAKKGINNIHQNNENSVNRGYSLKLNRTFVTDKISNSCNLEEKKCSSMQTEILAENQENITFEFKVRNEIKFISSNEIIS